MAGSVVFSYQLLMYFFLIFQNLIYVVYLSRDPDLSQQNVLYLTGSGLKFFRSATIVSPTFKILILYIPSLLFYSLLFQLRENIIIHNHALNLRIKSTTSEESRHFVSLALFSRQLLQFNNKNRLSPSFFFSSYICVQKNIKIVRNEKIKEISILLYIDIFLKQKEKIYLTVFNFILASADLCGYFFYLFSFFSNSCGTVLCFNSKLFPGLFSR